jgi:3',5'-cyclic AMP phosphodiesterase CpdA
LTQITVRLRALLVAFFVSLVVQPLGWAAPRPLQEDPLRPLPANTIGSHRFVMIGDAGTGDAAQRRMVAQLHKLHRERPFSHVLLLGDNVYVKGEIENFERAIGRPYRSLLRRGVRLLPVLGNHDAFTQRGQAQMRYFGLPGKRWYQTAIADGKVDLFALDTTLMVSDSWIYRGDHGQTWRAQKAEEEIAWLDDALPRSTAPYTFVIGHHPLYSSGARVGERRELRAALGDTLERNRVSTYSAGHQHIYERRKPKKGTIHFVSGGGGRQPSLLEGPGRLPDVHFVENHFVLFETRPEGLGFEAINADGNVIDSGLIPQRK